MTEQPWHLWDECKAFTALDYPRALNIHEQLSKVKELFREGAMAEVGTYRGGSARLIAQMAPAFRLHCFDTWQGMPALWSEKAGEGYFSGPTYFDVDVQDVVKYLDDCPNVCFHQGVFPETTKDINPDAKFVFVHFDGDLFCTAQAAIEYFWPRMEPGGIIVIDDWCRKQTPGVAPAFLDYLRDKPFGLVTDPIKYQIANLTKPRD